MTEGDGDSNQGSQADGALTPRGEVWQRDSAGRFVLRPWVDCTWRDDPWRQRDQIIQYSALMHASNIARMPIPRPLHARFHEKIGRFKRRPNRPVVNCQTT